MIHIAPEPSGSERFNALLRRLLTADWEDPGGPIRLSQTLRLEDLVSTTFFQNARVLLAALAESGGTAATATGNLNRVFVWRWILSGYVLNPLCALGLIEKQSTSDWVGIREDDSVRVTACWKKFLSFDRIA